MGKMFDLNIGEVLEAWETEHALREIIANALDEQHLTQAKDIAIWEDVKGQWHIRDYGRGLQEFHFKQDENPEKMNSGNLIGKFGVGLKDALAVFYRKNIGVQIISKHLYATLSMGNKSGFKGIRTLHVIIFDTNDESFIGTEYILTGISSKDIERAKAMFLKFSGSLLLEKTRFGDVYRNSNKEHSCIYINGVKVAQENNFMFSYNIINITAAIKKALNRERSNVGRTAYTDSIKRILLNCNSKEVLLALVSDLDNIMRGTNKDESGWVDISSYAAKELNKAGEVVYLSPFERQGLTNDQVEILRQSGKTVVLIPDNVRNKLGNTVTTFTDIMSIYRESFQYSFIEYSGLTSAEKRIYDKRNTVIDFLKRHNAYRNIPIKVSETIRVNEYGESTNGVFTGTEIIIKRSTLRNICEFLGTLEHEFAHAYEGHIDNTRAFENTLTKFCGWHLSEIAK